MEPAPLPPSVDVAIIGGGIVGVSAALTLRDMGVSMALFEKGRIAGEQSSRNWGWVRIQGRKPEEIPLMQKSKELWKRYSAETQGRLGFQIGGIGYLATDEDDLERYAGWLVHARTFDLKTKTISSREANRLAGRDDNYFAGGVLTPDDARAEPFEAVPQLAQLAEDRGASIHAGVAVRGLYREGGSVTGVVTEKGLVKANSVILAGGAWSRVLLENEGVDFPQLAVRSTVLRTSKAPDFWQGAFGTKRASIRKRVDGGFTIGQPGASYFEIVPAAFRHFRSFLPILRERRKLVRIRAGRSFFGPLGHHRWQVDKVSPFERTRVLDPAPDREQVDAIHNAAMEMYPDLRQTRVEQAWAGMIELTPDELPVIDHVNDLPGLVLATGFSGHGFGIGPGAGHAAACLAAGADVGVPIEGLSYSRLAGGRP